MPMEYKQDHNNRIPINPLLCKAYVSNNDRWPGGHQCKRKAKKDGWCSTHHPDKIKERDRKADERYKRERENSPYAKLDRARNRIKELKAELNRIVEMGTGEFAYEYESDWATTRAIIGEEPRQ